MENLWSSSVSAGSSAIDQLVTMSRLIGADPELVVWGGGNTSVKTFETDFRGVKTHVLRIKGSGSDLKTIEAKHFAGVRMDDVLPLEGRADMSDDEMVDYLARTLMDPKDPRPSIETLLHAFIPAAAVAHSHADAILSLINNVQGAGHVDELFGEHVVPVPYRRPGFLLSKEVGAAVRSSPDAIGVILMNHGLITWGDTCKEAYDRHIDLVNMAEDYVAARRGDRRVFCIADTSEEDGRHALAAKIAPVLRGAIGLGHKRIVLRYDDSPDVLGFVNATEARRVSEIGAATPDHILSTKVRPVFVASNGDDDIPTLAMKVRGAVEAWRLSYKEYYERNKAAIDAPMLEPSPRVILVPGVGMFTTGKDLKLAQVPADIYHHTISIFDGAEALGGYKTLSEPDAALAEYWPLELYKLTVAPPEQELSRRIALVTGAGRGIGKSIAQMLAAQGAHVAVCDIDESNANEVASTITAKYGGKRAIGLKMDVTDEADIQAAFDATVLAYGGLDILVSNAGIAPTGRIEDLSRKTWEKSLEVNATGHFLVSQQAVRIMRAQGLGGSIVFNVTKNVPAPGADFGAYSCAKAAEAQLCRILAVENGKFGIRCNMLNPDAVFEAGLWSDELKAERAKANGIDPGDLEDHYRKRSLLQLPVTGDDVAHAALFFASDRSAKTTGAVLPVDSGLREAFPR